MTDLNHLPAGEPSDPAPSASILVYPNGAGELISVPDPVDDVDEETLTALLGSSGEGKGVGDPLPILVGLSGKKRMGKDTLASQLVMDHGFETFTIADAIKDAALDVNPFMVNSLTGQSHRLRDVKDACGGTFEGIKSDPGWDPPVREFIQQLGSVMAHRDSEFWPRPVIEAAVDHIKRTGRGAVVTDVRFQWEVDMVREAGGVVVRVYRSDKPDSEQTDTHKTETALDNMKPDAWFNTTPLNETFPGRVADLVHDLMRLHEARMRLDSQRPLDA